MGSAVSLLADPHWRRILQDEEPIVYKHALRYGVDHCPVHVHGVPVLYMVFLFMCMVFLLMYKYYNTQHTYNTHKFP